MSITRSVAASLAGSYARELVIGYDPENDQAQAFQYGDAGDGAKPRKPVGVT